MMAPSSSCCEYMLAVFSLSVFLIQRVKKFHVIICLSVVSSVMDEKEADNGGLWGVGSVRTIAAVFLLIKC